MAILYVARSARLSDWASDVGLSKHIFKVGVTDEAPAALLAAGLAGETDWTVVRKQEVADLDEETVIARLSKREKPIDPTYYPRIKGAAGIFKVSPSSVQSHLLMVRTLEGNDSRLEIKLKATDFATFLIANALK